MSDYRLGRYRGRFCVVWYEDGTRHRHTLGTNDRAVAERLLRQFAHAKPELVTVQWAWTAYMTDLGEKPTAKTMGYTGKAVLPHFGHIGAEDITVDDCRSYIALRRADGRSDGAIHTELGHLRSALVWAQKRRHIDRAPHIERPTKPEPRDRYLTRGEAERLLDATDTHHIRLAIILMLGTAARVQAVLDLTWDRVDFDTGMIHLRDPDDKGRRKGRAVVPMNRSVRASLETAKRAALTNYVIEWAMGPVKSIRKGLTRAAERAKIEGVGAHVLRHTAAVWLAEAGVGMEEIAQYLGHGDIATTRKVYARYSPGYLRDAASHLEVGLTHEAIRRVKC